MSDLEQGKALARQRRRRGDDENFPRRRRPDPVQSSFPQISRRRRRRPLRQAPTRHALLFITAAPPLFSRRIVTSGSLLQVSQSRPRRRLSNALEGLASTRRPRAASDAPTRVQQEGKMLLYDDVQWQYPGELRTGTSSG